MCIKEEREFKFGMCKENEEILFKNKKKNNEVFSMQISRYLLSLIRLLNEVFIYHYYTKRTNKIKSNSLFFYNKNI